MQKRDKLPNVSDDLIVSPNIMWRSLYICQI